MLKKLLGQTDPTDPITKAQGVVAEIEWREAIRAKLGTAQADADREVELAQKALEAADVDAALTGVSAPDKLAALEANATRLRDQAKRTAATVAGIDAGIVELKATLAGLESEVTEHAGTRPR